MNLVEALESLTTTDNGDLTHTTSNDARLDMFYGMMENVNRKKARELTESAWKVDNKDTLKLIFYILDVRQGKSCNQAALFALQWLLDNSYCNVVGKNLKYIGEFGSYKDYVNLLVILRTNDEELEELEKMNHQNKKKKKETRTVEDLNKANKRKRQTIFQEYHKKISSRKSDLISWATKKIAQHFATQLIQDRNNLGKALPLSLAAKWVPTKNSALDQETGLYDAIAYAIWNHKQDQTRETSLYYSRPRDGLSGKKRRQIIQNQFRREYITPLRSALNIVETKLSNKQTHLINYAHVPSVSMKRNAKTFDKQDTDRFSNFVKEKPTSVKAGVLKPHELVQPFIKYFKNTILPISDIETQVYEAQWNALVQQTKHQGVLSNALAIVDVSGSMFDCGGRIKPIEVSVALGLLISAVAHPPWNDRVMTFSQDPCFFQLDQESSLMSKVERLQSCPWFMNTAFDKVFALILSRAQENKVPAKEMVRNIFVLSDMQFDEADHGHVYKTAHERIKAQYSHAGYDMPQLVYWNLASRTDTSCPVKKDELGTSLVSGFSSNILNLFMQDDITKESKQNTPMEIMRQAIDNKRYNVLEL